MSTPTNSSPEEAFVSSEVSCAYCDNVARQLSMEYAFFNLEEGQMNYWCGCKDGMQSPPALAFTDENLERWWRNLADVTIDDEECIDVDTVIPGYVRWRAGTEREDTWHWFDQHHTKGLAFLMYGEEGAR